MKPRTCTYYVDGFNQCGQPATRLIRRVHVSVEWPVCGEHVACDKQFVLVGSIHATVTHDLPDAVL